MRLPKLAGLKYRPALVKKPSDAQHDRPDECLFVPTEKRTCINPSAFNSFNKHKNSDAPCFRQCGDVSQYLSCGLVRLLHKYASASRRLRLSLGGIDKAVLTIY